MRGLTIVVVAILLSACSTSIKYSTWSDGTSIQSTALHFSLPASKITLAAPTPTGSDGKPASKPTSNCPSDVTDDTWFACLNGASPASVMAPPGDDIPSYVATPDDSGNLLLSKTAISGTAVTGQDSLYTTVTVKYTNNTAAVITSAGTAAVTGFGVAGPYGAVGGFFLGAATGILSAGSAPGAMNPHDLLSSYICDNDAKSLDVTHLYPASATAPKPSLIFPITIAVETRHTKAGDLHVLAPSLQRKQVNLPSQYPDACWHTLPNSSNLGIATPVVIGAISSTKPRDLKLGDGWLYRVVELNDATEDVAKANALPIEQYFADTTARSNFPYSLCRKVIVQVTWWRAFYDAVAAVGTPGALPNVPIVQFETKTSDSRYVQLAMVDKGGVINFHADCGANVTTTVDNSTMASISAAVTQAENIYKAELSYEASLKKK